MSFAQLKKDNITFNDATLTVTAGNTVSLSCTPAFSRPSPPTIDWYIGSVLKLSDSVQYRYTAVANDHNKMIYCQAYTPQQAIKAASNKPWLNVNGKYCLCKVRENAKIRNQYNQVLHLTQDMIWGSDKNTRKHHNLCFS